MKIREIRDWSLSAQCAAACLGVALVLNVAVVSRLQASHADADTTAFALKPIPQIVVHASNDDAYVRGAAARSPFDVDTPVVTVVQGLSAAPPVQPAITQPRLIGTVVQGRDSGFVIVEIPSEGMKLVRVGERAGELRLKSVSAGEATFEDKSGVKISLRASTP